MTAAPRLRTRRSWRGQALLMRALRVLIALVALQVTGVAHVFADLLVEETLASHVERDRRGADHEGDDDDADCPPGCPDCHHVAHALPVVPHATEVARVDAITRAALIAPPLVHPPSPSRAPPDRPPRV